MSLGSCLAAVSTSAGPSRSAGNFSSTHQSASDIVLSALNHATSLIRLLMHSPVYGNASISISTRYIRALGFYGNPSELLCAQQMSWSADNQTSGVSKTSTHTCPFHIPTLLTAHLKNRSSQVVQVLVDMDEVLESHPLLATANPPISTGLVAMELTTPQGESIPIQDLDPQQAIQVTLTNSARQFAGGRDKIDEQVNDTCPMVTLPYEGGLNFIVKSMENLGEHAGLYISFTFNLAPGAVFLFLLML